MVEEEGNSRKSSQTVKLVKDNESNMMWHVTKMEQIVEISKHSKEFIHSDNHASCLQPLTSFKWRAEGVGLEGNAVVPGSPF